MDKLTTAFTYTLKCGIDIWIWFQADDITSTSLINPQFSVYDMSGEVIDIMYERRTFNDILEKAHAQIYQEELYSQREANGEGQENNAVAQKGNTGDSK